MRTTIPFLTHLLGCLLCVLVSKSVAKSQPSCLAPPSGFGVNEFYCKHWCGKPAPENTRYLDDSQCAKLFPPMDDSSSRDFVCPSLPAGSDVTGFVPEPGSLKDVTVNTSALTAACG